MVVGKVISPPQFCDIEILVIFFQNVAKISRIYTRTISNFQFWFKDGKNEIRIDGFGGKKEKKIFFFFSLNISKMKNDHNVCKLCLSELFVFLRMIKSLSKMDHSFIA